MISLSDRRRAISLIDEAVSAGARCFMACAALGICARTLRRWRGGGGGAPGADRRPEACRPTPRNKLSDEERAEILSVCNSEEFASLPPSRIVPALADRGQYLASESSFYRILRDHGQQHHRGRAKPATRPQASCQLQGDGPPSGLDLGYHLDAGTCEGAVLL